MSAFLQLSSSLCPSGLPGASSGGGLPPIQPASSPARVLGSLLVLVSSLKRAPWGSRSGTDGVSFLFSWGACEMGTTPLQNAHIRGRRAFALPGMQASPPLCLLASWPPGCRGSCPAQASGERLQAPPPRAREAPARPCASICNVCRFALTPSPASPELTRSPRPQALLAACWRTAPGASRAAACPDAGRRPSWPRPRHNTLWARGLGRPGRALTPLMRGCTPG